MPPVCSIWSLCITYALSSRHINHSNPVLGQWLDPKGSGGFAPTWKEGFTSLASRKWQGLMLTAPGLSRSRASKEFKTVWIQLQPIVSPPGGCLHVSAPVRVATAGKVDPLTCPQEDRGGVQSNLDSLNPK